MERIGRLLLGAAVMAAGTALLGWWTVPVLAAVWGTRRHPVDAGLAGMLAWGGLLGWQAIRGPVGVLAERVAGVLALPAVSLPLLTVAFAGLLAWSAAGVSRALVFRPDRRTG